MTFPASWRATTLLIGAFLAGGVVGGAATARVLHDRPPEFSLRAARSAPDRFLRQMTRDLHLSPAQVDSIRAVLDRHRPQMDSLWREVRPRMEASRAAVISDIRTQLTPAQDSAFTERVKRFDAEHGPPRN